MSNKGMRHRINSPRNLALLDKRHRIAELARQGWMLKDIAKEVGLTPNATGQALRRYFELRAAENIDQLRAEQNDQIRDLMRIAITKVEPAAARGDWRPFDRVVKLLERSAKLNGTDITPEGPTVQAITQLVVTYGQDWRDRLSVPAGAQEVDAVVVTQGEESNGDTS